MAGKAHVFLVFAYCLEAFVLSCNNFQALVTKFPIVQK